MSYSIQRLYGGGTTIVLFAYSLVNLLLAAHTCTNRAIPTTRVQAHLHLTKIYYTPLPIHVIFAFANN